MSDLEELGLGAGEVEDSQQADLSQSGMEDSYVSNGEELDPSIIAAMNEEDDGGGESMEASQTGGEFAEGSMDGMDGATAAGQGILDESSIPSDQLPDLASMNASDIQAPAGASNEAQQAAERLAHLMAEHEAAGVEGDAAGAEESFNASEGDAPLSWTQSSSQSASKGGSRRSSARSKGHEEEKEGATTQEPSRRSTGRGDASVVASTSVSAAPSASPSVHSSARAAFGMDGAADGDVEVDESLPPLPPNFDEEFDEDAFGEGGGEDGFDEDYDEGDDGAEEEEEDDVRTMDDLLRAKEEREHLIEVNRIRQRQIVAILEKQKAQQGSSGAGGKGGGAFGRAGGMGPQGGGEPISRFESATGTTSSMVHAHPEQVRHEYSKNLDALNALWDELELKRSDAERKIDRLTTKLDAADQKATELAESFKAFKREMSRSARFSRTGMPLKLKRILAFEAAEEARDREVARVRLRHLTLLHELKNLEQVVRTKERLAEGLHLIDFEQLKIENQTLNEKIEERNDELHKLRKKTTTTVQVLTHIKEKLQCIKEENGESQKELLHVSMEVQNLRDQLTRTKHARDEARNENTILKQKQGFIGSDLLVSDFENRKGDLEVLRAKVEQLKTRWRSLYSLSERASSIEKSRSMSLAKTQAKNPGRGQAMQGLPKSAYGTFNSGTSSSTAATMKMGGATGSGYRR